MMTWNDVLRSFAQKNLNRNLKIFIDRKNYFLNEVRNNENYN